MQVQPPETVVVHCGICGKRTMLTDAVDTGWYPSYGILKASGKFQEKGPCCADCGDSKLVETDDGEYVLKAEPKPVSDLAKIAKMLHKIRTAHEQTLYRVSIVVDHRILMHTGPAKSLVDHIRDERDAIATLQDFVAKLERDAR